MLHTEQGLLLDQIPPALRHSHLQRGALLAPVNATLARCATGYPAVYRDDARFEGKVRGLGSQEARRRASAA